MPSSKYIVCHINGKDLNVVSEYSDCEAQSLEQTQELLNKMKIAWPDEQYNIYKLTKIKE